MANIFCLLTIVIVAASCTRSAQIQNLFNSKVFKQNTRNDEENYWRMDEDQRGNQRQRIVNLRPSKDQIKAGLQAITNLNEKLNGLEDLIEQGLPVKERNANQHIQISLLPSQIQKPDKNLHIYSPFIFYPDVLQALENNTSAYNDNPKRRGKVTPEDSNLKGRSLSNFLYQINPAQNIEQYFNNKHGAALEEPAAKPNRMKRMAQQKTKAKKEKLIKRARDKRKRKHRKRLKYLRKIGKIPKKKGDGGLNKVKKVYKRFRKGNSTHSFYKNTTQRVKIRFRKKTKKEVIIPRWVPDGGNSTENITSEAINEIKTYDASVVENDEDDDEDEDDDDDDDEEDDDEDDDDDDDEDYEDSDDDEDDDEDDEEDEEDEDDEDEDDGEKNESTSKDKHKNQKNTKKNTKSKTKGKRNFCKNEKWKHGNDNNRVKINTMKKQVKDNLKTGKDKVNKQMFLKKNTNMYRKKINKKLEHSQTEELNSNHKQNMKTMQDNHDKITDEMGSTRTKPEVKNTLKQNMFNNHEPKKDINHRDSKMSKEIRLDKKESNQKEHLSKKNKMKTLNSDKLTDKSHTNTKHKLKEANDEQQDSVHIIKTKYYEAHHEDDKNKQDGPKIEVLKSHQVKSENDMDNQLINPNLISGRQYANI